MPPKLITFDSCVGPECGKKTEYRMDTPVALRTRYVEGAGQLCVECYERIYGKNESPSE